MPPEKPQTEEKSSEKKFKRKVLSINDKLEIIKKMERGVSRRALINEYNIGSSTLYDIKKSKPKLIEFLANTDPLSTTVHRKNLRKPKLESLDKVLHEWFQVRRTEGVAISGPMIIAKAKDFAKQMQLNTDLNFSGGWLTRFKSRHGIKNLDIASEKNLADFEAAKSYCLNFEKEIGKTSRCTDQEIIDSIVAPNTQELAICSEAEGQNEPEQQKITWNTAQACMDKVLKFFEQNPSFSIEDVLQGYMLKNMMLTKNLTSIKQPDVEHS